MDTTRPKPENYTTSRDVTRLRLAATGWEGAAEALEPLRRLGPSARVAASLMVPDRRDWFAEALDDYRSREHTVYGSLILSAATLDELSVFTAGRQKHAPSSWGKDSFDADAREWPTLLDGVGPDLAEFWQQLHYVYHPANGTKEHRSGPRTATEAVVLAAIPTPTAYRLLVAAAGYRDVNREVGPLAVQATREFPLVAAQVLTTTADLKTARPLLALLPVADLPREDLTDAQWAVIEKHGQAPGLPVAGLAAVPDVLVDPPWTAPPVPAVKLQAPTRAEVHWLDGERERWSVWPSNVARLDEATLEALATDPSRLAAKSYSSSDRWVAHGRNMAFFAQAPLTVTEPLMDKIGPRYDYWHKDFQDIAQYVLARQEKPELAAAQALVWAVRKGSADPRGLLFPFVDRAVVGKIAEWVSSKSAAYRDVGVAYLTRHGGRLAPFLLPAALGRPSKAQYQAAVALARLVGLGHGQAVADAAADFGPQAAQAWAQLSSRPVVPAAKVAGLPAWLTLDALPQVALVDGAGALPGEAVRHLVTLLSLSTIDDPYPALDQVTEACTASSLARFAWGLFTQWQTVGYPSDQSWVMDALGLLGDDDVARALNPLVRAWPGESGHARAVRGLDVLLGIGTDVALMQLNAIAEKTKFGGLKKQARERIAALAEQRGLTPAQLSDRLVPTLGLDPDGTTTLDFGTQRFTVVFDEQLRPVLTDADGKPRKTLPKATTEPGRSETARFAALKKDVRAVVDLQLQRLEDAMATQRGWSTEEFTTFLVEHPLVWHLTRRLVWKADNGFFRVAEDRTFADVDDDVVVPQGTVRLAHQLDLAEEATRWGPLLADYGIAQPFVQVGRDTYAAAEITRFQGRRAPSGKVAALERHGWRRGPALDGGCQWSMERPVADGSAYEMGLDPGFVVGMPPDGMSDEQTLDPPDLTGYDPILASEIVRDLHRAVGDADGT